MMAKTMTMTPKMMVPTTMANGSDKDGSMAAMIAPMIAPSMTHWLKQ